MAFIVASLEHRPILQKILEETVNTAGETMMMGYESDLDWYFKQGFFLLDESEKGFFWIRPIDAFTLEAHANFLPRYRGCFAKDAAIDQMRKLFTELSVGKIFTQCESHYRHVIAFCKWLGFRETAIIGDIQLMECSIEKFITLDAELVDICNKSGFPLPQICPIEQAQFVGFFLQCMRSGLLMKGLTIYNRMAEILGWETLSVLQNDPIIFGIGDRQFSPKSLDTEV